MRKKNKNQPLASLMTAQDLQIKYMTNEIEGLRRSMVTVKKAIDAPLALWESHWFDGLESHDQMLINKAADLIARTLRPKQQQQVVITSTTPITTTPPKRKREATTNASARWKKSEDAILRKMKKAGKTNSEIAATLGRSEKAIMNRYTTLKAGK